MDKPTLRAFREQRRIALHKLADEAFISRVRLERIEEGMPAKESELERLLDALTALTGRKYKISDFDWGESE